jgi:hypothetical protein
MGRARPVVALVLLLLAATPTVAGEIDPGLASMYREWGITPPNPSRVVICHGFSCTFRTLIALGPADHARFTEMMSPGKASAQAERAAIAKTEVWFEKRIAPETGTANAKARAGGIFGYSRDRGQFDCIDSTLYTSQLLLVLDQLGLLRQHKVARPISRLFTGGGPHFTAVMNDRKTGQGWTVDPWTHNHAELPDVWPVEKWLAGG